MATSLQHMATCACGSVGGIVEHPGIHNVTDPVWVIAHENGVEHRNVRVEVLIDDVPHFRLKLEDPA